MLMYDERNSEGSKQKEKKKKRGGPGARKSSNESLSGNMLFMNYHSKD